MATNCIHNEVPKKSIAQFSSNGQRAVVETSGGKVFSFELSRPKGYRFKEEQIGFHPSMWLQGAGGEYRIRPSGNFPFRKLEGHLEFLSRVEAAIFNFKASLDPELRVDLRQRFAQGAAALLGEIPVYTAVKLQLMVFELPPEWDLTHGPTQGQAGKILEALVAKWR